MSSTSRFLPRLRRPVRSTVLALVTAPLLLAGRPAFGDAGSPGSPPPGPNGSNARWNNASSLKPASVPILGDFTWFAGHSDPRAGEVREYHALDIENGILFAATGQGLEILDIRNGPTTEDESFIFGWYGGQGSFPGWEFPGDADWFVKHLDAPAGNPGILALSMETEGFAIVNTSNPASPVVAYHGIGPNASTGQVYAVRAAGSDWAYALNLAGKVERFNMTAAAGLNRCLETPPSTVCPNVYKGLVSALNANTWSGIHGVGNFLATGRWQSGGLIKIWSLSDPAAPAQLLQINAPAMGVAMWQSGSSYYLARLDQNKVLTIHDVSCIAGGACSSAPVVWQKTLTAPSSLSLGYVTVSQAGGRTYLYVGGDDLGSCVAQREYLFDVTTPATASLDDLTPKIHPDGYWGWYYQGCPTGFNLVGPRIGKVYQSTNGTHFYRAAYSLLDAHTINVQSGPPTASFTWTPSTDIYPGTPVQFTDQSSGSPTSWTWTFTGGSPTQATVQNPSGVTFSSQGQKSVTLDVANQFGPGTPSTQTVTVLDPSPQLGSVTVTPANPLVCQPVTLTAVNPGGQPTLQYAWAVDNTSGTVFSQNNTSTSQVWNTAGAAAGAYTAKLTLSNGAGSVERTAPFNLGALPTLPLNGQFTPTTLPFTAGTVTFDVAAQGATEWNWDFDGDGIFQESGWTNDPVNGPHPTHSYSSTGIRQVRVKVRNCVETAGTLSAPVEVNITQVTPLAAHFQANELCPGICLVDAGTPVPFIDASTGAELWDYDWDGNGTYEDAGNAAPRSSHTYSSTGTFTPKLRVRRGANEESVDVHDYAIQVGAVSPPGITVSGPTSGLTGSSLSFSASGTGSCSPAASGWTWNLGGGTASGSTSGSSVSISWSTTGNKSISASNSACGSATGNKTVTITTNNPPPPPPPTLNAQFTFSPAGPKAAEAVSFNAASSTGSPTSYSWNFGDSSPLATGVQTSHSYATAGLFLATLTITKESTACPPAPFCESTISKQVSVAPSVVAQPGTLRLSLTSYSISEGAGSVAITVQRVSGDDGAVSVQYAATAVLATAGQDFTPVTGTLSWADNDTATKSFTVPIGNDTVAEANETVLLTLSAPSGGALIDPLRTTATLTIQDDDGTPGSTLIAPSGLTAAQNSTTTAQLAWADNSNNETGFSIEARTIAGSFQEVATAAANATSTLVADLDPSTFYLFRVRATAGTSSSPYSNEASTTTLGNPGACAAGAQTLCLNNSRFRVKVDWRTSDGATGAGHAVPIPSAPDSGLFYFFGPSNIELLVKQLNACAAPFNHYWTFYAATTNVEFALVVTDTQNGQTKGYFNSLNHSAAPVQDINAFATCP